MVKIRAGFVSNSSSSSFVCDACGYAEEVDDCEEFYSGFYRCENGHIICKEHVSVKEEELEEEELEDTGSFQIISSKACPICTMRIIRDKDLLEFVLNELNVNRIEAEKRYRDTFKS